MRLLFHWMLFLLLAALLWIRGENHAALILIVVGYGVAMLVLTIIFGFRNLFKLYHGSKEERRIRERDATTESPLEQSMAAALDRKGISYVREYRISRTKVDFAFPQAKLVVECDGWRYHQDKAHDRRRDAFLKREGWKVLRFTGAEIRSDVDACVRKISKQL